MTGTAKPDESDEAGWEYGVRCWWPGMTVREFGSFTEEGAARQAEAINSWPKSRAEVVRRRVGAWESVPVLAGEQE